MPDLRPAPTVHATITDSGGMLLDVRGRGHWYALTSSGALWWHHLAAGATTQEAADTVADYYRADRRQVRADMRTLAQQLHAHGLLKTTRGRRRHR